MIKEDDMLVFSELLMGVSNVIERQEARGQKNLVGNAVLPHKFNFCTIEQFEAMGIVFGDKVDELFSNVTLPEGWYKEATDHSMWSKLLDAQGRERANIFYKAAFYDRDAFLSIISRYSYGTEPVGGWGAKTDYWQCVVTDCGNVIWASEKVGPEPARDEPRDVWMKWHNEKDDLSTLGEAWLDEHFPNWKDPLAYWDV